MLKRFFSIVLVVCLMISVIPVSYADASTTLYYTTLELKGISDAGMNAVISGKYTAEKYNGYWCYKFTKGSTIVYIRASAFTKKVSDSTATTVSSKLTNYLNKFQNSGYMGYVYNSGYNFKESLSEGRATYRKNVYHRCISKFNIKETRGNEYVRLRSDYVGGITFEYHQCIKVYGKIKSPSNANEYKKALVRKNNTPPIVKPVWKLKVNKPGTTRTYLNEYTMIGKGYGDNKIDAANWIKIGYSTVKCGKDAVTQNYTSLLKKVVNIAHYFEKKSEKYSTGGHKDLSVKNKWCYESTFTSPIKFKTNGDYLETTIYLGEPVSKTKTKTIMTITFSVNQ